ncbi:MAG: DNA polymerase domain-containing protein [Thermoplasmata archaeon]
MLVSVEVQKKAHLFFRENGRVRSTSEEYFPEILLYDEKGISEKVLEFDYPGILEKGGKKFRTIFGEYNGYYIKTYSQSFFKLSSMVERYFNYYLVDFYNVDIRLPLRYISEKNFNYYDYKNGIPDFSGIEIMNFKRHTNYYEYSGREYYFNDYLKLMDTVIDEDPDIIIMEGADSIIPDWIYESNKKGYDFYLGRMPGWNVIREKEYFSYGYTYHKKMTYIPRGRSLIDPQTSFIYSEGGLFGVLASSAISSLDPSYASRSTPGTLISSLEVSKALRNGLSVPYHKSHPEREKNIETLIKADRGGLVYQVRPGLYWNVSELDFTSMYPSIIVKKNLSLETVNGKCKSYETVPELGYNVCTDKKGFLSYALEDFLNLRIGIKRLKKNMKSMEGVDKAFKWMLVTSFGYTGYRNAKFGSIEVHESINAYAREFLLRAKEIVEKYGFNVISMIVDSLWVSGLVDSSIIEEIEKVTDLPIELSGKYYWIKILPMKGDISLGIPGRYVAWGMDGNYKIRGIMLRRHDTPEIVKEFQNEALEILKNVKVPADTEKYDIKKIFIEYKEKIETRDVEIKKLLIEKRVNRYPWEYTLTNPSKQVLEEFYGKNVIYSPSEKIRYIIYSEKPLKAASEGSDVDYSISYYLKILRAAYDEIRLI